MADVEKLIWTIEWKFKRQFYAMTWFEFENSINIMQICLFYTWISLKKLFYSKYQEMDTWCLIFATLIYILLFSKWLNLTTYAINMNFI